MRNTYYQLWLVMLAMLLSPYLFAQTQTLKQGFENDGSDTWAFVADPAPYNIPDEDDIWDDTTALDVLAPANGAGHWFMRDLDNPNGGNDGFHTLSFDAIDISAFTTNVVSFRYNTFEYEDSDSIGYIIMTDNGTDWDFDNYVDLERNTDGWVTVTVPIFPGNQFVRLQLLAKQNGNGDYAAFDDVRLLSGMGDVIPPFITQGELLNESLIRLTFSEPMTASAVTDAANYTAPGLISQIDYFEPLGQDPYADISFIDPLPVGLANSLTVTNLTDLSGNGLEVDPYTFDFIFNNSTPSLVITEILYNNPSSDTLEFVEIYNAGDTEAALGGLAISGSFGYTFPAGLSLPADDVILLALEESAAESFFGLDFYDWGSSNLGNGDGEIVIKNTSGLVIDSVAYDDAAPWPTEADGDGPSLELISPSLDNNLGASWRPNPFQFADTDIFANPGIVSDDLEPVVAFAEATVALAEGSGNNDLELTIDNTNDQDASVDITVAMASTAAAGVDYNLPTTSVTFPAGSSDPVSIPLELLDNADLSGKYLILELSATGNAQIGANSRLIVLIQDNDAVAPQAPADPEIQLNHLGSFVSGGGGATAEIVAHDPVSQHLFVTNSENNTLEVFDIGELDSPTPINTINMTTFGSGINSVAVANEIVAVAVEGDSTTGAGRVVFFDTDGLFLDEVTVGVLPDMVTFTPDGSRVLTANEGEPNDDYTFDPEGSISIIDLSPGVGNLTNANVNNLDFSQFNGQEDDLRALGVRLFGPGASAAQDLEPEFIAVAPDGSVAYAACQENNAVIVVDLTANMIADILPLGAKDWTTEGLTLDASNRSPDIFFANWPIKGFYHPDAIATYEVGGQTYIVSANEGDARDYDGFSEEFRVGDSEIALDGSAFPDAEYLKEDVLLGRLRITSANGDTDGDGDYDELYAYGGRSFSIWNGATGELVYDSGNELELITAADPVFGALFNSDDEENEFKNRSDDKGPEPEAVTIGEINGRIYAFIGLERIGGIMVYDITDPAAPQFIQYINTRTVDTEGGDLSPEGVIFVEPDNSPNGKALLIVSYEVSGTVGVFEIRTRPVVSFAEGSSIAEEGAGTIARELVIERPGDLPGTVVLSAVAASTATDGEDYTLATTSIDIPAGATDPISIELDILDNTTPGGEYLILSIDESSTAAAGEEPEHILLIQDTDAVTPTAPANPGLQLAHLGSYFLGGDATAEILSFDPGTQRLFVTNSEENRLEILDAGTPDALTPISNVDLATFGGGVNSVAVRDGVVAVAVEGAAVDANGRVVFFDTNGSYLNDVTVGVLPDMLTFTPDGAKILTANEGEPSDDYLTDPEGSVSIIDLSPGVENLTNANVNTLDFQAFNDQLDDLLAQGVRLFGPNATVAQDLEPEFIAVSPDGALAYVACQENNALVIVDLATETITDIAALGTKDWSAPGVTLDASNESPGIFFANWPVQGFYHPDAITTYAVGGQTYIVSANEGDARDYDDFSEEFRVGDDEIVLDEAAFPDAEYLKNDVLLGRLRITSANGDTDGDGDYDQLFAYGARSFSIWNGATGELVYDSGNEFELITAADPEFGALFNTDDEENEFKDRSDDKGPEPEAVVIGEVNGRQYAFIGLERIGGVMVYDVTDPAAPQYLQYINTRTVDEVGGDLSPEGLVFVPEDESPSGKALLLVSYEVSGSIAAFEIRTTPVVAFTEGNSLVAEGSGAQSLELTIEKAGDLPGSVTVSAVGASTAVADEDYDMLTTSVDIPAGTTDPQSVDLNILDNGVEGGRYLILALGGESAGVGEEDEHILLIQDNDLEAPMPPLAPAMELTHLGSIEITGEDAVAEIVAHDGATRRLFVTNSEENQLEILDYTLPLTNPEVSEVDLSPYGAGPNSVGVSNGIVAVAMEADAIDANGSVVFFDTDGNYLNDVEVGVLPDMLVFTPDGNRILTANEGEPDDDYVIDPEGSVSIIDLSGGVDNLTDDDVTTLTLEGFNDQIDVLTAAGVRIFGPGATVAQDLEPEYIAITDDGATALVACQENNALLVLDLEAEEIVGIEPLGSKDWSEAGVTLDASNESPDIFFANWPIRGYYHPDAIDLFNIGGVNYAITANEGDARDYDAFSEEFRIGDDEIQLDETAFPDAEYLKNDVLLGRLRITSANGDIDGDGDYDELYAYGARSFTIWNADTGEPLYDSGDDLELITAADPVFGALFNSDDEENEFKDRSDDKGPEPEAVIVTELDGRHYAFVGLERIGGIMVYDITDPSAPVFQQYINTRSVDEVGGDLSPEGLNFIPVEDTDGIRPRLAVSYEVSGTVGLFELNFPCQSVPMTIDSTICMNEAFVYEPEDEEQFVQFEMEELEAFEVGPQMPSIYTYDLLVRSEDGCVSELTINLTVDDCTGTDEIAGLQSLELAPNPSRGLTYLELTGAATTPHQLAILTPAGQIVRSEVFTPAPNTYTHRLDLSDLPKGMYLLRLEAEGERKVSRLVIE